MKDDSMRRGRYRSLSGLLRDLDEGLLPLEPGDRLWKLYVFRPADEQATQLEHRIYSKAKADGNLALVTFAVHTPEGGESVRSGIARVPDLPIDALEHIIDAIRRETQASPGDHEEIDLTHLQTLQEQLAYLHALESGA